MELSKREQDGGRSPTETLVYALEEFGKAEPLDVLVIWIDENGEICWSQSTRSRAIALGMLEMVREIAVHDIVKERS